MDSVIVTKHNRLSAGAEMIRAYNASGLKLKDWLEENNITKDKFYYWRRKLRDTCLDEMVQNNEPDQVEFIEMPMHHDTVSATAPVAAASVQINGCEVMLYDTASVSFIRKLTEAGSHAE